MPSKKSTLELKEFSVKRFRSLIDVSLKCSEDKPTIICGENNIGKTNFLRAMYIFFNSPYEMDLWDPSIDLPFHIYSGSRGGGTNSEFSAKFFDSASQKDFVLKVTYKGDGEPHYKLGTKIIDESEAEKIIDQFRLLYIKSNNIDIPELISEVLEDDVLLPLDRQRTRQAVPLKKLAEFIEESEKATKGIEKKLNTAFANFTDFDGALKGNKIKIQFAEFSKLRDAVKNMTSITIDDGNSLPVENKGSGAQRAILLTLMQFISNSSKRNVIWAIDEPEVFLQPKLQKRTFKIFKELTSDKHVSMFLTTHSPHFIDLENLKDTHLFKAKVDEKVYVRKKGKTFVQIDTRPIKESSNIQKALLIKEHLGMDGNDGWKVLPFNLIVEGEEDKVYLESLLDILDIPKPNIIWAGGASKIRGYLQYFETFADELSYKPRFLCLFDEDKEGRGEKTSLKKRPYKKIETSFIDLPRSDGIENSNVEWEIEDFLPPELIIFAVNKIARKNQYKIVTKEMTKQRLSVANRDTQILIYCENAIKTRNPNLKPLKLDDEGRKKQICRIIRMELEKNASSFPLNQTQKEFLRSLTC